MLRASRGHSSPPSCTPQIYEREAIRAHLRRSGSDPVTRQALPNGALTPIFLLRSRAMEYRENTCGGRPSCLLSRICATMVHIQLVAQVAAIRTWGHALNVQQAALGL